MALVGSAAVLVISGAGKAWSGKTCQSGTNGQGAKSHGSSFGWVGKAPPGKIPGGRGNAVQLVGTPKDFPSGARGNPANMRGLYFGMLAPPVLPEGPWNEC